MGNITLLNYSLYDLLIYFIIYSFLGWVAEVAYAFKNQRKFVNRGFLHGPLCPIYGSCLLLIILLLSNFEGSFFKLFIIATIATSVIEYFTGFILEKLFKTKYWDYTEDPFNLHGRICLHFSIMWGLASIAMVKIVHPTIVSFVNKIPSNVQQPLFFILFILLLVDFTLTIKSLINFKKFSSIIQFDLGSLAQKYELFVDSHTIADKLQQLKSKLFNKK
ncbi:MAG: putative ABC transporter permease [Clostridiaceae bacterium]|nr:putative ABC transporter permease [Clostridiaceae bacterium]